MKNAIAVAILAAATGPAAADVTLEPGLYEVVKTTNGEAPEKDRQCVTAADIAKGMQPSNLAKDCRETKNRFGNGRIDYASSCKDGSMTLTGTYAATSFTMDSAMHFKVGDRPLDLKTHMVGKKVGATCKKEE